MEKKSKRKVSQPLISVITVCYNAINGIEKTIQSVVSQKFHNFEYIIIDGRSSDGTIDVIKKYENNISRWISEPDAGIYNAMNKAIFLSNGKYCLFMNAGDYLLNDDVLSWTAPYLKEMAIYTGGCVTTQKGKIDDWYYAPKNPTLWDFYTGSICHQASFIPRDLLVSNLYDEELKLVSDWKFWLQQIVLNNYVYYSIPVTVCVFNMDGATYKSADLGKEERKKVLSDLIPYRILSDYYERVHNEACVQRFHRRVKNYFRRHVRIVLYKIKEKRGLQY